MGFLTPFLNKSRRFYGLVSAVAWTAFRSRYFLAYSVFRTGFLCLEVLTAENGAVFDHSKSQALQVRRTLYSAGNLTLTEVCITLYLAGSMGLVDMAWRHLQGLNELHSS